ncbi:SUR7/PalI family-domain-containing protein [Tricharina praecox]|uniref:SUR7/PalI family-domain-containing protein n=1 Tax=Tricharina praecox TaxID=43433 RepID=UPI00221FB07A|nr:SUR7/PalI family-domain-containing protein [Tricharina praecox]KAI5845563.1 SUR7/PalI family-domain-containing protein [Tricharina praecox]
MFRPATPLSILLLAAFALLLLSTLSSPIINSINIATFGGVKFGVFGWCSDTAGCSKVGFGYDMDTILANEGKSDFSLPSKARNSLTNLLIVHPIAAFLTLILFILSVAAHLNKPAHSPKYLLALLILCLPTLIVTLLAFLVDILIFLPHVQWGGWIVLAATILIVVSGFVMCGMRRQIVGRIARSKRIQDNAEMNGQGQAQNNYFRNQPAPAESEDKLPEFAMFEVNKPGQPSQQDGDRVPLNPRTAALEPQEDGVYTRSNTLRTESSDRSNHGAHSARGVGPMGPTAPMGGQYRGQYAGSNHSSANGGSAPYGPPPQMRGGQGVYAGERGGQGGYAGERGFGGERGYGGGGGGGPQPMPMLRTFDGPPQGRLGPSPGPGGFRGPPAGYDREPRRGGPYQGGFTPGPGSMNRGPPPPPHGYGPQSNYGSQPRGMGPPGMGVVAGGGLRAPPPPRRQQPPQEAYDFPAGIENTHSDERREFEQTLAPVNTEVIGRALSDGGRLEETTRPQELAALSSESGSGTGKLAVVNESHPVFGEDSYIPPRAQRPMDDMQSPAARNSLNELPGSSVTRPGPPSRAGSSKSKRVSDSYYEDVAPQFDTSFQDDRRIPTPPLPAVPHQLSPVVPNAVSYDPPTGAPWNPHPPPIPDNEDDGPRSPTMSTASGFTSISQRGINPRWQEEQSKLAPGRPQGGLGRHSVGLQGNPDFELPVPRGRAGRGGRAGMLGPGFR